MGDVEQEYNPAQMSAIMSLLEGPGGYGASQ